MTGGSGIVSANLDLLVDESVGVIASLRPVPAEIGTPDFAHAEARLSDTGAFTGFANPVTVFGAGVDRAEALEAAAGAALLRYAAAFHDRSALPLATASGADFTCVSPADFALFSEAQYQRPGFPYLPFTDDTPVRWTPLIDLTGGEIVYAPAALVFLPYAWLRSGGDPPIAPPPAAGLGRGGGVAAAALAALADVVCCDAAALFWFSMTAYPRVRLAGLPPSLAGLVSRLAAGGGKVTVLDITTDNRLTTFLAVLDSAQPTKPAYVLAAATDLDPTLALAAALGKLAHAEAVARRHRRDIPPVGPAEDWLDVVDPEDHLLFAADPVNRTAFDFVFAGDDERDFAAYENVATGSPGTDLDVYADRIARTGHRAYAAALTPSDIEGLGIHVCRAIVPGYQPLFHGHWNRALGGSRIYEIPRKLGYRGVSRGAANPMPHPFL